MTQPLHVIILAAGAGKRMKSVLPKVLQPVAGQPMLAHVIATARELKPDAIHIVYGHGGDAVRAHFSSQPDLLWAEQSQQLGTGHAVAQAMPEVPDAAQVLVLYGDVPLIRAQTLRELLDQPGRLAVLAAEMDNPTGYGRIVRDAKGQPSGVFIDEAMTLVQAAIPAPGEAAREQMLTRALYVFGALTAAMTARLTAGAPRPA